MVALSLQNLLDDAASFLERMRACITWQVRFVHSALLPCTALDAALNLAE